MPLTNGSAPSDDGAAVPGPTAERGKVPEVAAAPVAVGRDQVLAAFARTQEASPQLLVTIQSAVNATLYDKLNYNFIRDIAPVASFSRQTLALEVTPGLWSRSEQKAQKFVLRSALRPNQISFSHSLGQNLPCHSLRRHGRSTSGSRSAGPTVGASESDQRPGGSRMDL